MIVVDSSVAVAAALAWHEFNVLAVRSLPRRKTRLLAPVGLETYSVLTRLPSGLRVEPAVALDHLTDTFAGPPASLDADGYADLLELAATQKIRGGAVYDALVGATAGSLGATLLSLDRRAARTYDLLGVDYRLVSN